MVKQSLTVPTPAGTTKVGTAGGKRSVKENKVETTQTSPVSKAELGSTISHNYGRRTLKTYPITDGELSQLFGLGSYATLCFSVALGFLGFAIDLSKDISMSQNLPDKATAFWDVIEKVSYSMSGVLILIGIVFVSKWRSKVSEIKKETTFGDK